MTSSPKTRAKVMADLENLFYPDVLEEPGRLPAAENYRLLLLPVSRIATAIRCSTS